MAKAKKENKLIIVSVGYAACHWCHVMEHESFEDADVAKLMNEYFVCIKVDREERPDVDDIYMTACHLVSGSGGWPLNAIALPDGRPVYAGTYFPKDNWIKLLDGIKTLHIDKPKEAESYAQSLTDGIKKSAIVEVKTESTIYTQEELDMAWAAWRDRLDPVWGGQNRDRNKFPLPIGWDYLLDYLEQSKNEKVWIPIKTILDKMALGGIYDQIGGGFARYSVDKEWKVPHFEKMLYDNAQLIGLYARAFSKSKDPLYKWVVENTFDFLNDELSDKSGAYYSSLDADSEGEEGKFYVWTHEELENTLGKDAELMSDYWEVTPKGNFEHGNSVLFRRWTDEKFCEKKKISISELNTIVKRSEQKLLKERNKRIRPGLDDKILTGWNALAISGLTEAYKSFSDEKYLDRAKELTNFILKNQMQDDGRLYRNFKNGKSSINAFLQDYSLVIQALVDMYQVTFDISYLDHAEQLSDYCIANFFNPENGMFYFTSKLDPALISRQIEIQDNVIPASNSILANALYDLGTLIARQDYLEKSEQMLRNVRSDVIDSGPYYANWLKLLGKMVNPPYEIVVVGKDAQKIRAGLQAKTLANALWLGGTKEGRLELMEFKYVKGETMIYVCKNKACQMPTTEIEQALGQIK